jgi:hypothetical protein
MDVLAILLDVVKQPALIVGIFSFIGLMALRKPFHKVLTGTLRPVLGYIMMMAGGLPPGGMVVHFPGHRSEIYEPRHPWGSHCIRPFRQSCLLYLRLGGVQGRPGGR